MFRQCSNQVTGKPASQAVQAVAEQKKNEVAKHEHLSRKGKNEHLSRNRIISIFPRKLVSIQVR